MTEMLIVYVIALFAALLSRNRYVIVTVWLPLFVLSRFVYKTIEPHYIYKPMRERNPRVLSQVYYEEKQ